MLTITRFYAIAYPRVKNEVKRPTNSQLMGTLFCLRIVKQLSIKVRFQVRRFQFAIIISILSHFFVIFRVHERVCVNIAFFVFQRSAKRLFF